MKKVYEASTGLEAHMVKNLLENENIESRIDGEYLQGGVGDLQAIGVVRVLVEETDYSKAKEILDEWESKQQKTYSKKSNKTSNAINGFIVGVILTSGIVYFSFNSPVTKDGIDYNGDSIFDERWTFKAGRLVEKGLDRNLDGNVDYRYHYDLRGLLKSADADDNFDGKFESRVKFKNGSVASVESDKNQDGRIDYRANYKYGVINTAEFIDQQTGRIRKRQYFELGKLVSTEFDIDGDGQFDTQYQYDWLEEKL